MLPVNRQPAPSTTKVHGVSTSAISEVAEAAPANAIATVKAVAARNFFISTIQPNSLTRLYAVHRRGQGDSPARGKDFVEIARMGGERCNWTFLRLKNRKDPTARVFDAVDRKSVVSGKRVSVRVDLGGRSSMKKTKSIKKIK